MSNENSKLDAERSAFEAAYRRQCVVNDCPQLPQLRIVGGSKHARYADAIEQALWEGWQARASLPVGVPDGYALVPVEPTPEMLAALADNVREVSGFFAGFTYGYRAMLAAAPAAPTVKAEQVQAIPQEWWQIIHDTLRNYRLTTLVDQDGDGYPLIDAMTADVQPVSDGINECDYLTDAIWNALPTQAPSLLAAGSAGEKAEVVAITDEWPNDSVRFAAVLTDAGGNLPAGVELMTVAQHERIVAALSAQQSAPDAPERVSVPRDLLADLISSDHDTRIHAERRLYAILASHGRGEA